MPSLNVFFLSLFSLVRFLIRPLFACDQMTEQGAVVVVLWERDESILRSLSYDCVLNCSPLPACLLAPRLHTPAWALDVFLSTRLLQTPCTADRAIQPHYHHRRTARVTTVDTVSSFPCSSQCTRECGSGSTGRRSIQRGQPVRFPRDYTHRAKQSIAHSPCLALLV